MGCSKLFEKLFMNQVVGFVAGIRRWHRWLSLVVAGRWDPSLTVCTSLRFIHLCMWVTAAGESHEAGDAALRLLGIKILVCTNESCDGSITPFVRHTHHLSPP